jgi:sugar (pentulose or hexulose) kinase
MAVDQRVAPVRQAPDMTAAELPGGRAQAHEAVCLAVQSGDTALGIELGSTRIKAALIGPDGKPIATGAHEWSNRLVDGLWTYGLNEVWVGVQDCYAQVAADVKDLYGARLTTVGSLGISAMMHGYLAFDASGQLLVPYRTWRNTNTERAALELTELFAVNIPHRWSIAHLYQTVLEGEDHLPRLAYLTTLAGYVHWKLTGRQVLGVGDASGMFPIDTTTAGYDRAMLDRFDGLEAVQAQPWRVADLLPAVLTAGEPAGTLTEDGARLLDPGGHLEAGVFMCPPEGDAGTGMVATNSVAPRTGNVSAGTSIFAMIVLEQPLRGVHREIDLVTTPSGHPVAMVHCNNGTGDLDAWVDLFAEFARAVDRRLNADELYQLLYAQALEGDADAGGLLAYNYLSGEPITAFEAGRPIFTRTPNSRFSLANFMRAHLFSSLATLRIGMDVLLSRENVTLERMYAHGGLFKTRGVGQRILAAAIRTPVSVGDLAGEGGAWGMALLADYARRRSAGESLDDYLGTTTFANVAVATVTPEAADVAGFDTYMVRFGEGLSVERAAITALPTA